MKILFLSLADFASLEDRGIYTDLLREFVKNGHEVCAISPVERRGKIKTHILREKHCRILKIRTGNIQKTNLIEKGISVLLLEPLLIMGIRKYFKDDRFDLVLYATPPVTFLRVIRYVKRRDEAMSYLMLKDIWPQGLVDLKVLRTTGFSGVIYHYFKRMEKELYQISDYIGCMSEANREYLLEKHPKLPPDRIELCPNSLEPCECRKDEAARAYIRRRLKIPADKTVFLYGGNIGRPQNAKFIVRCLRTSKNPEVFFLIIGAGTKVDLIKAYIRKYRPDNVRLLSYMPKDRYEGLVAASDVGLIFLDRRFTIPHIPSRLLSYMQASLPVLAATDSCSDIGSIIESGKFGLWCESRYAADFHEKAACLCNKSLREEMGRNARRYLEDHYTSARSYAIIMDHFIKK